MPDRMYRQCTYPGCASLTTERDGRCGTHPRPTWAKRHDAAKRITGRANQRLRRQLFDEHPLCEECERNGRVSLAVHRDHIIPLELGGRDERANTQALCIPCHEAKTLRERVAFMERATSESVGGR